MGLFPDLFLSFWVRLLRCFCPKKVDSTSLLLTGPEILALILLSLYRVRSGVQYLSSFVFLKLCVSVWQCMRKPEDNTVCFPKSFPTLFSETWSLTEPEAHLLAVTIQGSSHSHSPYYHTWLLHEFLDLMLEWQRPYPLSHLLGPHLSSMLEQN